MIGEENRSQFCVVCKLRLQILSCPQPNILKYCSQECQRKDESEKNVAALKQNVISPERACKVQSTETRHVHKQSTAQLAGGKCLLECYMNSIAVTVLLDTGAQVSMLDRQWREKYLFKHTIRPLEKLMGVHSKLDIIAVNGMSFPFDGWVGVQVDLPGSDNRYGETHFGI